MNDFRVFKSRHGAYYFVANDKVGMWIMENPKTCYDTIYTARDGESFEVNKLMDETTDFPDWVLRNAKVTT